MALYVVVRHRSRFSVVERLARQQQIEAITTTAEIGRLCTAAGERTDGVGQLLSSWWHVLYA